MSDQDMAALQDAQGVDASKQFLTGMIQEHQAAIAMAEDEIKSGQYPPAVALAHSMVTTTSRRSPPCKAFWPRCSDSGRRSQLSWPLRPQFPGVLMDPLHPLVGVKSCSHHRGVVARRRRHCREAARFRIEDIDRFSYAPLRFFLKHTHILGRAWAGTRGRCTLYRGPDRLRGYSFR
jgi:Domain of unknown function (DUF305)